MHVRIRLSRALLGLLIAAVASLALSACGSSSSGSGNAAALLKQTFTGSHAVKSGNLSFSLTVHPSGSTTLTGPISLTFGGPFQSLGTGKLPKSNFSISISAQGQTGTLGILSTGTAGYVSLQGTSYQLPTATFQKLESSFSQIASSPGGGSNGGQLSQLGIHPLDWLIKPSVVGNESIGGSDTTHIKAEVNVSALLTDLNTFLGKASSLGISGSSSIPTSISASTRQKIAGEIQSPTFDVWTGKSDKTVRRLAVTVALPVSGSTSTALGGLRSAQIGLTLQYADLNLPQTIDAPTNVRPYSEFASKLKSFLTALQGSVASTSSGSGTTAAPPPTTSTTPAPTTTTGSTTATKKLQRYEACLQQANNDLAKAQKCAALINGQ
jgi:hypothetical protein